MDIFMYLFGIFILICSGAIGIYLDVFKNYTNSIAYWALGVLGGSLCALLMLSAYN